MFASRFMKSACFALGLSLSAGAASALDPENTIYLELKDGRVVIELRPDLAPNHVARIKELTREKFYDGIVFHRVIEGFMAQTGDPDGNGTGGSGQNLDGEFSAEKHVRGTLSMARAQDPNSADSQFFIVFQDAPWLDQQYTVAAKLPMVVTNVGGNAEAVLDKQTGLVVSPHAPKELGQALTEMLERADLRERYGSAGLVRLEEKFSHQVCVDTYDQLYQELIKS